MKERVELIVKEEKKIQEEVNEIKQELQIARAKSELERTQKLLREEEDRTNEAQLWKHYNEQRCNQVIRICVKRERNMENTVL